MPTFNYTGAAQSWVVPANVRSISVDLVGARGGQGDYSVGWGGGGRTVVNALPVTPGSTIYIYVGGQGIRNTGGFNGGGTANWNTNRIQTQGGGGGGATDIRIGGVALSNRIVVASGGGGGGGYDANGVAGGPGGNGGGLVGTAGTNGNSDHGGYNPGGGGGTQSAGGSGYTNGNSVSTPGSFGQGGSWTGYWDNIGSGGGGGGGYFGGGAGGGTSTSPGCDGGGGGGGGSSYSTVSATFTSGYNTTTDGSAILTPVDYDAGIRYYFNGTVYGVGCEPVTASSKFRIMKNGVMYGIRLVDITDASASHIRVYDGSNIKAFPKFLP